MTAEQAPLVMNPAVTPNTAMPNAATEHAGPGLRVAEPRFLYATGARPLDGYTIKRGVGRGGFGEVYFAVSDAGKEVALKLIRRNLDVELRGVTHCLNLKHPNLVALYDVRQDEQDNRWVIMEFVSGESLEEAIRRHPTGMPLDAALDWLRGIAAGVTYLHSHGIVHRDLKPGNVFRDEGIVKLGDYGLSKFISCSRRSGQTESIGTVHYMAPEIANGRYGKEIDIYALGIVLYEMLTGRVPFEGESVGEVLMKHLTAEPDLNDLSEPLRSVVARALAKDPAVRFNSVEQLMAALPQSAAGNSRQGEAGYHAAGAAATAAGAASFGSGDEEPVLRFVREQFHRGVDYWKNGNLPTLAKVFLILFGIFAGLASIKLMVIAVVAYGGYRVLRWVARLVNPPNTAPIAAANRPAVPVTPAAAKTPWPAPPNPAVRTINPAAAYPRRGERAAAAIVVKSTRERVADLAGSLLFSATASLAFAVVMVLLRGQAAQPEQFAWLTLTSTLGAWAVLIPSKLWEGTQGEQALRRFTLLVIGLGFGAAAFGLDNALLVNLPFEIQPQWKNDHIPANFYSLLDGSPLLPAFLTYFGFLFVLLRWWRQADPLRSVRLSLWTTVCTVFVAWVLNFFWPFPQPWGLMVAAIMSMSIQLASPWVPEANRPREPY
jgi:hypothetical protein